MRRIDRYFLAEMTVPAIMGVVILLVLLLGDSLYTLLRWAYSGVDKRELLQILVYKLPELVLKAVPGALLLGTALAINRLERDREIQSLRLAGVRLSRIVAPFVLLGLLWSVGLFVFQDRVMPHTSRQAERLMRKIVYGTPTLVVQPDVMFRVGPNYLYAKQVDTQSQTLYGVIVCRMQPDGLVWLTIPRVENHDGQWVFGRDPSKEGDAGLPQAYFFTTSGDLKMTKYLKVGGVDHAESWLNLKQNNDLWTYMTDQPATPDSMTLKELQALKSGVRGPEMGGAWGTTLDPRKLDYYIHSKFAVPLSALVAVLIAIPFAVRFGRAGGHVGLLVAVVLSFFFVISGQWAKVLAEANHLHPILAAWTPDAFFGLLGLGFLFSQE